MKQLSSAVIDDKLTSPGFEEQFRRVKKKFPDFSVSDMVHGMFAVGLFLMYCCETHI